MPTTDNPYESKVIGYLDRSVSVPGTTHVRLLSPVVQFKEKLYVESRSTFYTDLLQSYVELDDSNGLAELQLFDEADWFDVNKKIYHAFEDKHVKMIDELNCPLPFPLRKVENGWAAMISSSEFKLFSRSLQRALSNTIITMYDTYGDSEIAFAHYEKAGLVASAICSSLDLPTPVVISINRGISRKRNGN